MRIGLALIGLSVVLSACRPTQPESQVDIEFFTKEYNRRVEEKILINDLQKGTLNKVIAAYDIFLKEKEQTDFQSINTFAKQNNLTVNSTKDDVNGIEENFRYVAKFNDGSNVSILFQHYETPSKDIHRIYIYGLTENQCKYLHKHYQYNPKFNSETLIYQYKNNGLTQSSNCSSLTELVDDYIAVSIEHQGKLYGKDYSHLTKYLKPLVEEDYKSVIKDYPVNLYFTEEPASHKTFYDGADFVINRKTKSVFAGALNKDTCKALIYYVSPDIKYKVNGKEKAECEDGLNLIELYN